MSILDIEKEDEVKFANALFDMSLKLDSLYLLINNFIEYSDDSYRGFYKYIPEDKRRIFDMYEVSILNYVEDLKFEFDLIVHPDSELVNRRFVDDMKKYLRVGKLSD